MSLIGELFFPHEARSQDVSDLQNPAAWVYEGFGLSGHTTSGEHIGPETSLTVSAYFAGIRAISEDIAKLPVMVFRKLKPRGRDPLPEHPVTFLFDVMPNPEMTCFSFREVMMSHIIGWGNFFAEIVRDKANRPVQLWPIHPSRVRIRRDKKKRIVYDILADHTIVSENQEFDSVRLQDEDVLHIHGLGSNGLAGFSVATLAAESLGLTKAAERFGAAFFGNGATVGGTLEHPHKLDDDARENLRASWNKLHQGSFNAHNVAILEEGMKYTKIGIPPEDAQFLETRTFQVSEVARWLRIPNHKIQHLENATFSNIEQQSIEYVQDSLSGWITRIEKEVKRKLFTDAEKKKLTLEHNLNALLRGDLKSRANFYRSQFNIGALEPNEIRELENMNPLGPEGDKAYIQLNMTTLESVSEGTSLQRNQNQPETDNPEDEDDEKEDDLDEKEDDSEENDEELDEKDDKPSSFGMKMGIFKEKIKQNMPLIDDTSGRLIRKEIKAITKLMAKYPDLGMKFVNSLNDFYDSQEEYIVDAFTPLLTVFFTNPQRHDTFAFIDNVSDFLQQKKTEIISYCESKEDLSAYEDVFMLDVSNNFIKFCESKFKKDFCIERLQNATS